MRSSGEIPDEPLLLNIETEAGAVLDGEEGISEEISTGMSDNFPIVNTTLDMIKGRTAAVAETPDQEETRWTRLERPQHVPHVGAHTTGERVVLREE